MLLKIVFCYFNEKRCIYCLWLGCLHVDLWKFGNSKKLNLDVSVLQTCAGLWSPVWITKVSCSRDETAEIRSPSAAQQPTGASGPRNVKARKGKNLSLFGFQLKCPEQIKPESLAAEGKGRIIRDPMGKGGSVAERHEDAVWKREGEAKSSTKQF